MASTVYTDNTSEDEADEEQDTMYVKETSRYNRTKEHDINPVSDMSEHYSAEGEDHGKMHVKETYQHNHIKEHDINPVTDVSEHYSVGGEEPDTLHVKEESLRYHIDGLDGMARVAQ